VNANVLYEVNLDLKFPGCPDHGFPGSTDHGFPGCPDHGRLW